MSNTDRSRSSVPLRRQRNDDVLRKWVWSLGAFFVLAAMALASVAQAADRPISFADLAERLKPAVVNVSTSQ